MQGEVCLQVYQLTLGEAPQLLCHLCSVREAASTAGIVDGLIEM